MKSASMTKFDYFYLGSLIVDLFATIAWWDFMILDMHNEIAMSGGDANMQMFMSGLAPVLVSIGFVFSLLLWSLVSIFRIGFIRFIIAAFVALNCLALVMGVFTVEFDLFLFLTSLISVTMTIAAVYFVFQPDAGAWLRYED